MPERQSRLDGSGAGKLKLGLKGGKLLLWKNDKERFQQDDSLAEASVQIVMVLIEGLPQFFIPKINAGDKVIDGLTEILPQIFHHFLKGCSLVDKAGALGKEHTGEKARKPGGPLTAHAAEVVGVKRRRVWNQPKMFGVTLKTIQNQS